MTGISEDVPATSVDLPKISEQYRICPKMFRCLPNTSKTIWGDIKPSLLEHLREILDWIFFVSVLKNKSTGISSQAWGIALNAWDRTLWWDSRIIRESCWYIKWIEKVFTKWLVKGATYLKAVQKPITQKDFGKGPICLCCTWNFRQNQLDCIMKSVLDSP